jgi:hypothetical protein
MLLMVEVFLQLVLQELVLQLVFRQVLQERLLL